MEITRMMVKTELFLIPLSTHGGELRILVKRDPVMQRQVLPHVLLRGDLFQRSAQEALLRDILSEAPSMSLDEWFMSARYRDRVVDVFDRDLLFENSQSIAIVRAVAVPEDLAQSAKGTWVSANEVFSNDSLVSDDCKRFIKECIELIPHWVKNSSLVFELLASVFAIQDLRTLVGVLIAQEIDAGNFHRRLKRLDVLRPLVSGQRVHRWEFCWEKDHILKEEGLVP